MDSGNSGSMQSSSCGDEIEEYDSSRAESNQFSMFLNNPPLPTQAAAPTTIRTRSISHLLNPPSQMFDPLPNYYMMDNSLQKPSSSSQTNQNSFLNLDMMWSKARSEQNNNDLNSLMVPSSSSSSSSHQNQQAAFLLSQVMVGQTRENINVVGSVPTTHHSLPLDHHQQQRGTSLTNDQQTLQNNNNNNNMGRNPKKRSRASRRAPTTVLTTDTTNFRAMVQEFTGIPAPPFSSPFPRTRLDLFGSSRSMSSSHMDPPSQPPYLLRPFAQKIQSTHNHHSFPPSSSSMVENLLASNNSATINYHLSHHHHHPPPPLMQHNQILGFQSISQTPTTKYPIGSHQQPSLEISPNVDSHIKRGSVFEELAHVNNTNIGNVVHRQNMVPTSSDGVNNNNNMCNSSSENQWGTRTNSTSINGGDHGRILGSLSGIEERNCTSDFGVVKGQECAVVATTTRGEGTVESWINCSSSD